MQLAVKLITPALLGKPYTTPTDPKTGAFSHHIATDTTFRVLCNCATAQPVSHTQRHVGSNYTEYRYATEAEIWESLKPRMVEMPKDAVMHHPV